MLRQTEAVRYLAGHEQIVGLAQTCPAQTALRRYLAHPEPQHASSGLGHSGWQQCQCLQHLLRVNQGEHLHEVQSHRQCGRPQGLMVQQVHLLASLQLLKIHVVPVGYPGWAEAVHVGYVSWAV